MAKAVETVARDFSLLAQLAELFSNRVFTPRSPESGHKDVTVVAALPLFSSLSRNKFSSSLPDLIQQGMHFRPK